MRRWTRELDLPTSLPPSTFLSAPIDQFTPFSNLPSISVLSISPHSMSEPSLFTPGERAVFEGFSRNCRPPLRRRPSPLPLCRSCDPVGQSQSQIHNKAPNPTQSCRPVYTHFSQPIRPNPKLVVKPGSQSLTLTSEQSELRPLILQYRQSSQGQALSVRGKPCLPSSQQPPPSRIAPAPVRTQLHIFLPIEGAGEEEEVDSESVDEGFMDELDSKITSLKIQQRAALSKLQAP